jgi:YspA, cpYpsA-related SLOG family
MKAIISGGRDFSDKIHLETTLKYCLKWWNLSLIITGGATGADTLAHNWATSHGLQTLVKKANWEDITREGAVIRKRRDGSLYDALAGHHRNQLMLNEKPNVVIAFKGGTGTEQMITISRKAGVPVFIV